MPTFDEMSVESVDKLEVILGVIDSYGLVVRASEKMILEPGQTSDCQFMLFKAPDLSQRDDGTGFII